MRLSFEWVVAVAIAVGDLTLLGACSPAPAPVASSMRDPSNPNAAESVDPTSAVHITSAAAEDAGAVVYACPMHPEVTSDHAAHCPKCGMTLVRKK